MKDLLQIPNLVSLSRILLAPLVGYFLWKNDDRSTLICLSLLVLAGVSDGLDGYLARRLKKVSPLGIVLDPVADKIFAGLLIVFLVLFRGLPVWLASVVVGRDLLILAGGTVLLKKKHLPVPSNLTGKYTFTVIIFLLGSYIIGFPFGITLYTYLTVIMTAASIIIYGRVFRFVRNGHPAPKFVDRPVFKTSRILLTLVLISITSYYLYLEYFK